MSIDLAKKVAACAAVENHLKSGMVVGIGSGSTIIYAVERIAEKTRSGELDIICIPTSYQVSLNNFITFRFSFVFSFRLNV